VNFPSAACGTHERFAATASEFEHSTCSLEDAFGLRRDGLAVGDLLVAVMNGEVFIAGFRRIRVGQPS
jgi:hypothetical protein